MQSQKRQNDLFVPKETHSISRWSKPMPQPVMLKNRSWMVLWRLTRHLELTPPKYVLFIIGDWNVKVRSQEIPGVTSKFGLGVQNEAGQRLIKVLSREHTGHSQHLLSTTQEKTLHMDITRWSTPKSDLLYSLLPKMGKLYTVIKNKIGSWVWLRSGTPYCQIQT